MARSEQAGMLGPSGDDIANALSLLRAFNGEKAERAAFLFDGEAGHGLSALIKHIERVSFPIRHSLRPPRDPDVQQIGAWIILHREPSFRTAEAKGLRQEFALRSS